MSVQDTVGSAIAFAGIVHLGPTIPSHLLKCILDVRDMVTVETADFEVLMGELKLQIYRDLASR